MNKQAKQQQIIKKGGTFLKGLIIIFTLSFLITGCSSVENSGLRNDTIESATNTFVESLIKGDKTTFSELNKAPEYTNSDIEKILCPQFAGKSLSDFNLKFKEVNKKKAVRISSKDGSVKFTFYMSQIGDKFYFGGIAFYDTDEN